MIALAVAQARSVVSVLLVQQGFFLLLGVGLALWLDLWPASFFAINLRSLTIGFGLPIVLVLSAMLLLQLAPVVMHKLDQASVSLWRRVGIDFTLANILLLSLSAGIAEEVLFRGALQLIASRFAPVLLAIVLVSVLFGLLHAISREYVLFAAAVSVIFSLVFHYSGSLAGVIIAHTVYDVWALKRIAQLCRDASDRELGERS